ncbi:MAG: hypothetical protein ACRD8O_06005 [Bryobacteraceae bacterium]
MLRYREVQRRHPLWWIPPLALIASFMCTTYLTSILDHRPPGVAVLLIAILSVQGVVFCLQRMVTLIEDKTVCLRLGRTLKRIPLSRIRRIEVQPIPRPWNSGVWIPAGRGVDGWIFNLRARAGVQLVLREGQRILIGSRDPEALAAAIDARRRVAA